MSSVLAATSRRTAAAAFRRAAAAEAPTATLVSRASAVNGGTGMGAAVGAARTGSVRAFSNKISVSNVPEGVKTAYKYVFKSNITYLTYVIVGAIAVEAAYGGIGDWVFNSINRGKLYEDIDWSKFIEEDDDEEEEEE